MKNRALMLLALLLALLTLLSACAAKTSPEAGSREEDADPAGLAIEIDPDSVTPTGLTLTVRRTAILGEWIYGSDYTVERKADAGWEPVPVLDPHTNNAFTAEGHTLLPGGTEVMTADWSMLYGELPPGQYRIGKRTMRSPGTSAVTVWAAFEIKE